MKRVVYFLFFAWIGIISLNSCHTDTNVRLDEVLENYIRSIPKKERQVFQNYRRIWLFLARIFSHGDLPTHQDFQTNFHYSLNDEKFLLRAMFTKDSLWNEYAFYCLDTLIKFQYQKNNYQAWGLQKIFHYSEKDSGYNDFIRFKGIVHYTKTAKYVQKEFFSKYVDEIYPIPLMLDFTMPAKAKSYFCVNYDEVQSLDSIYNEFAYLILRDIRWFSGPLMDTLKFKAFISEEEKKILLQEYYQVVKHQQMCGMPEEDWQHRSVRPVIDAFILMLAKNMFHDKEIWKKTGLSPDLIYWGLTTLANQWMGISPWLHLYITSSLQSIFLYYYPESKIVIKFPSGKESIRRTLDAKPILIAPIKIIYAHPQKPIQEIWLSIDMNCKQSTWKILKTRYLNSP